MSVRVLEDPKFLARYISAEPSETGGGLRSEWLGLHVGTKGDARALALRSVPIIEERTGWRVGFVTIYTIGEQEQLNLHGWQAEQTENRERIELVRLLLKYGPPAGHIPTGEPKEDHGADE